MSPLLRTSVAVLLLAVSVYGQSGRIRVTATNILNQVFVDGIQMTPLQNATDWTRHDELPVQDWARLVAIRATNILGDCSGILAATHDFAFPLETNEVNWKCVPTSQAGLGWQNLGFDDSNWPSASQHLQNGGILTGCSWFVLPALPTTAWWIWTSSFQDGDLSVSCRGYTDVCEVGPCQNGGTCNQNHPSLCTCPIRWQGSFCELPLDECVSSPCRNNGECELSDDGYICKCPIGFTGTHCETDITDCASQPCENGGTCNFEVDGGYTCSCTPGFTGLDCETNIDECASDPCLNGATCIDGVGEATCQCVPGYTGVFCQININECLSNPCLNAGSCEDLVNGYRCSCHPGWFGANCEIAVGGCESNPCQNGGTCTLNGPGGAIQCICTPGWSGPFCTSDVDECSSNPCKNGGTCVDGDSEYECFCESAWEGPNCEFVSPNCGSILAQPGYPPINTFSVLCQIDIINHANYLSTPCNELLKDLNYYDDADTLKAAGGTFGCYRTRFPDEINNACVPDYGQDVTLSSCLSCTHLGVCIKYPDGPIKSLTKKN